MEKPSSEMTATVMYKRKYVCTVATLSVDNFKRRLCSTGLSS